MHISEFEYKKCYEPSGRETKYSRAFDSYDFSKETFLWSDRSRTEIGFKYEQVKETRSVSISVLNRKYSVPREFKDLIEEITFSKEILTYPENWDTLGAKAVNSDLYLAAIDFLINYSLFIYRNHNIIIGTPEINPCPSGSVDLSWRTDEARLLVNFKYKKNEIVANFYGAYHNNFLPRQGVLDIKEIDESFAVWMKTLS